ncbi:hypothetical protein [Halorhabdus sp. CUG00001]|uniref:hypothetical protein n=1 Tax=Halorhabdus sp. CUG00001 TaxID=2600297 RepID=UPI00131C6F16|nr:hypothetical protein [Halorhabdus sp. CUG00001]
MTRIFVGPVPLVDLGIVGETKLLGAFDGDIVVPQLVAEAVSTEPAKTNLAKFVDDGGATIEPIDTEYAEQAQTIVGVSEPVVESRLLEPILAAMDGDEASAIGLVTDDRPFRTIADGLGATVTGTFGVVVRAASEDKYLKTTQAKRIARRIDSHGLHLTGALRAQAIGDL